MRLYHCLACACSFAIHFPKTGKRSNKPLKIVCPLCGEGKIEEVDAIKEVGGHLLTKAFELWKRLPDGD